MKTNQSLTTTNFIGYAQEEYENLKPLIEITKAFVRSSNQYIYIIDFLKKDFLYVSDKIVRLCGEEIDGKKRFNYEIYLKHVPTEEQKMLSEINEKGLGLFHTFPTNERTNYTLCYDIDLIRNKKKTLLNHKLTPLAFTSNGQVWIALCAISPSAHKESGHVLMLHTNGTYYEYDLLFIMPRLGQKGNKKTERNGTGNPAFVCQRLHGGGNRQTDLQVGKYHQNHQTEFIQTL